MPASRSYEPIALNDDDFLMADVPCTIQNSNNNNHRSHTEGGMDEAYDRHFSIDEDDVDDNDEYDIEMMHPPQHHDDERSLDPPQTRHSQLRPPSNYICPLTLQVMDDPYCDGCGHCFDREAITNWLEYHELCPISRKPLEFPDLVPAVKLNARIQQWKANHPEYHEGDFMADNDNASDSSYSIVELMLLPQERKVLNIIKFKARNRNQQQARSRCMWALSILIAALFFIALCLAFKFLGLHLRGSL